MVKETYYIICQKHRLKWLTRSHECFVYLSSARCKGSKDLQPFLCNGSFYYTTAQQTTINKKWLNNNGRQLVFFTHAVTHILRYCLKICERKKCSERPTFVKLITGNAAHKFNADHTCSAFPSVIISFVFILESIKSAQNGWSWWDALCWGMSCEGAPELNITELVFIRPVYSFSLGSPLTAPNKLL